MRSRKVKTTVLINLAGTVERMDEQILPALYNYVGQSFQASPSQLGTLTLCRALLQAISSPISGLCGAPLDYSAPTQLQPLKACKLFSVTWVVFGTACVILLATVINDRLLCYLAFAYPFFAPCSASDAWARASIAMVLLSPRCHQTPCVRTMPDFPTPL